MSQTELSQWRKSLFDAGTLLLILSPCLVAVSYMRFSHVPVRGRIQEFGFYVNEAEGAAVLGTLLSFFGKSFNRALLISAGLLEIWAYYSLAFGIIL